MLKSDRRIFVISLLILILLSLSAVSASEEIGINDTISNDHADIEVSPDSILELNSTLESENMTDTLNETNLTLINESNKEISKETIEEDDSLIENLDEEIDTKVKVSILSADGDEILYISPTGSATASGTRDDPLDSINSAIAKFSGDGSHTIKVMDGTYTSVNNSLVNTDLDNLNIVADTDANPIFNLAYNYNSPLYWTFSGNNIYLEGLKFSNIRGSSSYIDGSYYYYSVLRFVNASNVLVENCAMDRVEPYKFNLTNSDNISFKNCSFSNSTSSYYMFASENSNFTIEDSNLTNISTSNIVNSTFKLINNTFSNINNSNLFNVKNSSAEIINNTVKDSYFSGSYGFFQIRDDIETNISFVGNNFTNLTGRYDLINSNSNQHVPRNIVIANNSFSDVSLGINAQYANLTVENNTFKNMSSSSNSYPTVFSQYGNLSFKNNNYTDSSSLIRVSYSNGTIENNNFLNNVPNYTGIIYSYGSNLNISGNNFTNNSGNNNSISINNGNYTINDNIFKDNNGSGHEVYVSYYDTNLDLYDNVFENNTGVNGSVYLMGNASVHNNNFTHNNASLGAAIYINYNNSWNNYYNNSIKVYDNNFDSNNASYGGAIYYVDYYYDSGIKDIYNNTFTNNTALKGGAIFSNQSKNATFEGNEFINNSADMGGAIYIDYEYYSNSFRYNNSNNAIKDNKFIDNTAQSGGAVVFYTTNSTVEGNEFISNNATRYGGGALVTSGNNTSIVNNTFINNTAMLYAGAIGTNDSEIIGNTFENNNAYQAGAILTINSTIKNNTFDGNNATRGPAIVYIDSNNYTVPVCNCENCTDCNMTNCTCENCNITDETIPLLDENEGLDFDKDVYVYHDDHVLNVVQDLNGMYYLYEGANVTKADEYYYWAYCIEKNNSHPWLNNGTHGILVEDLYFVRNSLDGSYVGDYLKILISYCYHNLDEDIINVKDYIYIFTDTDYRNSSDRIVKKIIQIAGNEDTVLENGNNWINGAWNCLEFYTFINPTTRQNLILTNSCMPLDKPDFNVTKRANKDMVSTGEIVNYTIVVTNNGTTNLHGITVSERPESMLTYVSFNDYKHQGWIQTGDLTWTLNRTLRVNQTAEFVVNFRVNQVTSHTFINNQLEVKSNETNIKNTTEKIETRYPQLQTTKVALDPIARPNSGIRFLLLVKNIGTETAYNVSIIDTYSSNLMSYVRWSPYKGTFTSSYSYTEGNIRFNLTTPLAPGQEAGVYISFRTANITGTTIYNYLHGYINNHEEHSSSNFTRIPGYSLIVDKSVVGPNENITVGEEVTYAIRVRNTGEGNLTNLHIDDYIPDGLQYLRFYNNDGHNWTYYEMPDGTHRFTLTNTLYNSQTGSSYSTSTIYVVCRAMDIGKLNNIATAKADFTNESTDDENVTITPYGFRVEKIANNLSSQVDDQISFTIRVTNTGILPLTGIKVDETVSEYMVYDHFVDASERWVYNDNHQWVLNGSLNVSDYSQFDVFYNVTKVPSNGVLVNTIVVSTNETGNKTAHNQTDIYTLSLTKISNNPESRVGDQVSFTIVLRYDYSGTSTKDHLKLDGIFIKDLIPDGLVYDHYEDNSSKWSYDPVSDTWKYDGKLSPNNQLNLTLFFNVTKKDNIINVVIGGTNHSHNVTANNSTNSFYHSMLIEKISLNQTVFVGDITEFVINVTNNGDSDLTNVRVRDVIPEGLEYIDYSNKTGNWTYVNSADGPVWTYEGILAPGDYGEFIVRFNTTEPGTFVNMVYGISNETKEIEAENLTKVYNPHMIVQKISLNESVYRGDLTEFRILLVNDGDYDLTDVSVDEIIPAGLSYYGFVDDTGKWSYDEENHRFNYDGIFAKREVLQFVVVFNTTKAGNFTNNVVARSNETEEEFANNTTKVYENDFDISKISNNKTVAKGDKVEFSIVITNVGKCDLRELVVEESSFEGLKYVGYIDESGKWFNNGLQWVYDGALAPGETTNFTVIFEATELGNLTNIVVGHSYHVENKSANNTTEVLLADVDIAKISLNKTVVSGDQTLFEVVVVNTGAIDLTGLVVTDKFPDGLSYSSFIDESGKWSNEGNKWYYDGTLKPGESSSFIVVFDTEEEGIFNNIVTVETNKTQNKSANNTTEVLAVDVDIAKISLNQTVYSGEQTLFEIVVSNTGAANLTDIVVTDQFPDGLSYSSFIDESGKWSNNDNKWHYDGTLAPGESASFIVVFDTDKTGIFNNIVTVETNKTQNKSANNTTEVLGGDVNIQKITLNQTVYSGEQTLFEVVVENTGKVTLNDIVVTDKFPDGLSYSSFIDESGKWSNEDNKWYYSDSLKPGESASFIVVFDTDELGVFNNIVTVETNKTENKSANNTTEVLGGDIDIVKITLNETVYSGEQTLFEVLVVNTGKVTLNDVVVTDKFPDGLSYSSFIDESGKWSNEGNKWYYRDSLRPGESASFIVVFDTNKTGIFNNKVTVESSKTKNKSANNTTAVVVADITIQKITLNRTVYSGNQTRFMIVVTNNGSVELSEIVVTDEFPDGLTYSSFIDSSGKWSNEGNKWYYNGTLKPGESASFIVVFDTNKTGNYTNIVYVVSNKVGPRYSSNITEVIRKIHIPPGNHTPPVPEVPGKPVIPTNPDKPKLVPHNPSVLSDIKAGNPIALLFISITLLGIIPLGMSNNEESRRRRIRRTKASKIKEPKEIDKKTGLVILSVCLLAIVTVSAISAADTGDLGFDESSDASVSYVSYEVVQDSYSTNEVYVSNEYDYYDYSADASSGGAYYAYDTVNEEYIVVEGNSSYSVDYEVVYVDGEDSNMNTYGPNSIYSADESSYENVEYESGSDYVSSVAGYHDSTVSNDDNKAKSVYMASALSADEDVVIYVSPTGTTTGSGTIDDPVSTISVALNRLNTVTGTKTIIVRDGNYSGLNNLAISTGLSNLIIKAEEGANPVFNMSYYSNRAGLYWTFTGENISINGLNFVSANQTYYYSSGYSYHAVLKFIGASNVLVSNCTFEDTKSYQINMTNTDNARLEGCTFTNGSSRIFSILNSNVTVDDSIIMNASTSYIRNSTFNMTNSVISDFNKTDVFDFDSCNYTIANNTFKDMIIPNSSNRYAIIYTWDRTDGGVMNIINNTFANFTGTDTYLIYGYCSNRVSRNFTIANNTVYNIDIGSSISYANVTFENNSYSNVGPGRMSYTSLEYSNVTARYNNFTNCSYIDSYSTDAAPLKVQGNGTVEYNNFINNTGRVAGGALSVSGRFNVSYNNFTNNSANQTAGAIRLSGNVNIFNNSFVGNNGTSGAISSTSYSNTLNIFNNSFVDNNGTNGTVCISGNSTVYNNSFINNTVSLYGGAIYANYDNTWGSYYKLFTNVTDNIFDGNSAEYGGAIYYLDSKTYTSIKEIANNTYINNYADFGGAIFTNKTSNATIADSDFINNSARIGGAIFIDYPQNYNKSSYDQYNNTNVTIKDNNFIDNSAQSAGAVVIYSKDSVIENNNFTGNNATRYGGGALVSGGANNTIFNNSFENNSAMLYAGAIGTNNSLIINNTFNNNSAYQAGAILSINSSIENNTFDGNTANRGSTLAYVDNYDYNGTSLVNNNTGLNVDEDIYVYNESSLLRVALNNNDMYFLYNNASVTLGDNYTYWAYCIEYNNSKPWLNNGTDGILVEDMYFIRNSLDGSYVGDYLKVLVSYFYLNILEDEYNLKDYVYVFTDTDYRNNDSRIIKRIINLTESPDTYLENGNNWINGVWNCLEFYSFINPTTRQNLILINSCSPMELPDFSAQKDASKRLVNAGDIINYTVTVYNNGTVGLHNVTVVEMPNSMLNYVSFNDYLHQGWVKSEDNLTWVLNRTLRPHETGKFVINFEVGQFNYLMNITNVIQISSDEKSTKVYEEKVETKWPRLEVQKITLNQNVTPGSTVGFLLLVKNTGTLEAHNVTLTDYFNRNDLIYNYSWAPYIGDWSGGNGWGSSNDNAHIDTFRLNQVLYPGERAGLIVYFIIPNNTTKYSISNTVQANATNASSVSITNYTNVVRPSMGVYKRLDSPTTAATIGEEVTFAINVFNTGGVNLTGVYVNDIIPYGLEYLRFYTLDNTNWTHLSQADGTHRFMLNGTLTPYNVDYNHYQSTLYIVCRATELGNHYNVAVAGSDITNTSWSQANVTVIKAGMRVEKISVNPIASVGDMISYKIRVTNIGQENLTGIYVNETPDSSMVFDHFVDNTTKWIYEGNNHWVYNGSLEPYAESEFEVFYNVTSVPFYGNVTNRVIVFSNETGIKNATNTSKVYNLTIRKVSNNPVSRVGDQVSFTIVVRHEYNYGNLYYNRLYLSGIHVRDIVPDGLVFDHAENATRWIYNATDDTWYYNGTLASNSQVNFTLFFNVTKAANITNFAIVGVNESSNKTANNTTNSIYYDMETEKIALNETVYLGNITEFLIRVNNTGDMNISDVFVKENIPDGLVYYDYINKTGNWTLYEDTDEDGNTEYKWIYDGILEPGACGEFIIRFTAMEEGTFINSIVAGSNQTANKTAYNRTKVLTPKMLVSKITLNKTVYIGELTEFKVTVTNDGTANLTGVYVVEVIPSGLEFVGFKDDSEFWTFDEATSTFRYNNPLEVGQSAEFTVIFNATKPGNFTNIVEAGSNITNKTKANNTTEVLDVDIDVLKVTLNQTVFKGHETGFEIVVTNIGMKELTDIRLKEIYPEGLVYSRFIDDSHKWFNSGDGWIYTGSLDVGESTSLIIIFNTTQEGVLNNTIEVSSNETKVKNSTNTTKVIVGDIDINKISINEIVLSGKQTSFDIVVVNSGDYDLTGVVVTDEFPDGLSYSSFIDDSGKWSNEGNKWYYDGTLKPGESASFTVVFDTNKTGTFVNVVTVTSNQTETKNSSNTTKVVPADVDVNKISNNGTVFSGEQTSFDIVVVNSGDYDLTDIVVTDEFPDGLSYSSFIDDSGKWSNEGNKWYYNGILKPGESARFTVVFDTNETGTFVNFVTVSTNETDIKNSSNITKVVPADIDVNKISNNGTVFSGEQTSFDIVVVNSGDYDLTGIVVTDEFPDGLSYSSFIDDSGKWSNEGNKWYYDGTLKPGESASFTVVFDTNKTGTFVNFVTVSSNQTGIKNSSNITKVVPADIDVNKITLNDTVFSGEQTSFDIVVVNTGEYDLTGVVVTDEFPDGLSYSSFIDDSGKWSNEGNKWYYDGILKPGESASFTVVFDTNETGTFVNFVTVSSNQTGIKNSTNITKVVRPDIGINKITLNRTVYSGEQTEFLIVVVNTGDYDLTGVVVTDQFPMGLSYTSFVDESGMWSNVGNKWYYNGTLEPGQSASFKVIFDTFLTGNYTNEVIVESDQVGPKNSSNVTEVLNKTNDTPPGEPDIPPSPPGEPKVPKKPSKPVVPDVPTKGIPIIKAGNPLLALLLVLAILGLSPLRRKRK